MKKVARVLAEPFAKGIEPNVAGNTVGVVSCSQDVIVKFLLPQSGFGCAFVAAASLSRRAPSVFRIFARGRLLEISHEREQVASWFQARNQRVDMIRHHAIRGDGKSMCDGLPAQSLNQPRGVSGTRKNGPSARTTNRNEIRTAADVIRRMQPDVFVPEDHADAAHPRGMLPHPAAFVAAALLLRRVALAMALRILSPTGACPRGSPSPTPLARPPVFFSRAAAQQAAGRKTRTRERAQPPDRGVGVVSQLHLR